MSDLNKIAKLHHQEREAERENNDFISKHNTMLKHSDKYKMQFFPVDGDELRSIREAMVQTFKQTQMEMELTMYWDKKSWSQDSDFWAWINASRERSAIFHLFNLKGYPDGWTVSMVSEYLGRDRTSVSRDLTDCQQRGFIYRNKSFDKQRYYLPSERLLNNGTYYAEYYVDLVLSQELEADRRTFFDYRKHERQHLSKAIKSDSLQQKI